MIRSSAASKRGGRLGPIDVRSPNPSRPVAGFPFEVEPKGAPRSVSKSVQVSPDSPVARGNASPPAKAAPRPVTKQSKKKTNRTCERCFRYVGGALLDCLVVGAGPVGLLLASELAARGCKVVIIDALLEPAKQTKASAVVPRSLEVLPAEVEGKLLLNGNLLKSMQVREKKEGDALKTVLDIKTSSLEVYGGILGIRQQETEKYLTEYLTTLPDWFRGGKKTMEIQRGVLLESFTEGPTGVQCVLKTVNSGGLETVSCKFLVGCDGGRSNVRKHLGFSFEGTTTPEYFFGLDACFQNFEMDAKNVVSVSLTQDQDPLAPGFAFNIPFGDGNCLLLVDVDLQQQKEWVTGELDRNGLPVLRQPEVEDVLKVARSRGLGANLSVKPGSVRWLTHFRVNSRQVECYGRGRIFLAGDACHCHSPLGGQGMNMGFQDAKNLAWKLALAIKCGGPTSSLLLSYESERKTMESKLLGGIERLVLRVEKHFFLSKALLTSVVDS
eukprot:symbB.v1.2.006644.t1/scaffold398.1/size212116/1